MSNEGVLELKELTQQLQREIEGRKQVQAKLQQLHDSERKTRQELERQIGESKEFIKLLVHELKTPITSMIAACELLIDRLPEGPLLSLAKSLGRGASSLDGRVDELLDLAKIEVGMLRLNRKLVDPLALVQKVYEDMAPAIGKHGQSLTLNAPLLLPKVYADEDRLRQVILNLLHNSSKFTPDGGQIILRTREQGGNLLVEVVDTGPGIADEEQHRLFEAYYQVESNGKRVSGLGLGLALCKSLVEMHGGQIWVKSRSGEGSTFGFSMPLEIPV